MSESINEADINPTQKQKRCACVHVLRETPHNAKRDFSG